MKKLLVTNAILLSAIALTACSNGSTNGSISEDKATSIALKDAKLNKKEVSNLSVKQDEDDGNSTYEIDFNTKKKSYDYTINAKDGKIIEKSTDTKGLASTKDLTKKSISQDKAKEIALKDADVSEKETSMMTVKKDMEDATSTYEIEFTVNNKEYDYTINAKTGDIIEKSIDQ
ncbi:hypothetical protein HMPREF9318_01762 [Streptococcus urinalis FB127-CNA-2]|uniref:Peptidase propeptide and YpeB domain protein n=1 Tax=Streptococcus urinalis 2285-97 TaxID=764291 RepID=G5KE86_9STRE|nr:PepSY domain-containing protein [Streptococcus urinalis]EHJ57339.1 peptidase propeptide and YpeB domain protein [Streptococcus urinalis 2285-97]EKS18263.1 hypothetical protein HMPREF9318_01762 [Streptococcus urinalis FB127-CNA-2]VEF32863.1 lipoprotein [Streptococcus urinalis]